MISGGTGTCASPNPPCDGVFDPDAYTVPAMEDYAALMWQNRHLPAVGPTLADTPINVTDKLARMLNALEHAHIYIDQLNSQAAARDARIATQEARIAELERRIAAD